MAPHAHPPPPLARGTCPMQFVDNQDVLDLIEGRMGILELLDEQCRWGGG